MIEDYKKEINFFLHVIIYLIIIVIEQNDLNKQTENYKLSLRKKKLSEFISNKRHLKKREENKNKSTRIKKKKDLFKFR